MSDSEVNPEKPVESQLSKLSNADFMLWLMEFSPTGALAQIFIMTAVNAYAKASLDHDTSPKGGLVNAAAWRRTAKSISDLFDERHGV